MSGGYHRRVPQSPTSRRSPGWVPKQHGAWAMLALPFTAGAILRSRDLFWDWYLVPLFAFWVTGYLTFNAASCWLKAPASRRRGLRRPLVTYAAISAAFGLLTLALAGPAILGWAPLFVPLVGGALWLAARRQERALLGGGLTVAAAALMTLVARFTSPLDIVTSWGTRSVTTAVVVTSLMFGYLFGTVLYVKTMIRERGEVAWLNASIGWHAALTIGTAGLAWTGTIGRTWPVFFLVTTVRAWLMPRLARTRPISPKAVGLTEVGVSLGLLAVVALG